MSTGPAGRWPLSSPCLTMPSCPPGVARSQPPVAHAGQVYGEQPPKKLEPASEGKVQGPAQLQGGAPGQPAWPGHSTARALDRPGPSFCLSVSLCV